MSDGKNPINEEMVESIIGVAEIIYYSKDDEDIIIQEERITGLLLNSYLILIPATMKQIKDNLSKNNNIMKNQSTFVKFTSNQIPKTHERISSYSQLSDNAPFCNMVNPDEDETNYYIVALNNIIGNTIIDSAGIKGKYFEFTNNVEQSFTSFYFIGVGETKKEINGEEIKEYKANCYPLTKSIVKENKKGEKNKLNLDEDLVTFDFVLTNSPDFSKGGFLINSNLEILGYLKKSEKGNENIFTLSFKKFNGKDIIYLYQTMEFYKENLGQKMGDLTYNDNEYIETTEIITKTDEKACSEMKFWENFLISGENYITKNLYSKKKGSSSNDVDMTIRRIFNLKNGYDFTFDSLTFNRIKYNNNVNDTIISCISDCFEKSIKTLNYVHQNLSIHNSIMLSEVANKLVSLNLRQCTLTFSGFHGLICSLTTSKSISDLDFSYIKLVPDTSKKSYCSLANYTDENEKDIIYKNKLDYLHNLVKIKQLNKLNLEGFYNFTKKSKDKGGNNVENFLESSNETLGKILEKSELKYLNLNKINLSKDNSLTLLTDLISNFPLRELYLSGCSLSDSGLKNLVNLFTKSANKNNKNLFINILDLSDNNLTIDSQKSISQILNYYNQQNNDESFYINLSRNKNLLKNDSGEELFKNIATKNCCLSFGLSDTGIGPEAIESLEYLLNSDNQIIDLDISKNGLKNKDVEHFEDAIMKNDFIKCVNISGNEISWEKIILNLSCKDIDKDKDKRDFILICDGNLGELDLIGLEEFKDNLKNLKLIYSNVRKDNKNEEEEL